MGFGSGLSKSSPPRSTPAASDPVEKYGDAGWLDVEGDAPEEEVEEEVAGDEVPSDTTEPDLSEALPEGFTGDASAEESEEPVAADPLPHTPLSLAAPESPVATRLKALAAKPVSKVEAPKAPEAPVAEAPVVEAPVAPEAPVAESPVVEEAPTDEDADAGADPASELSLDELVLPDVDLATMTVDTIGTRWSAVQMLRIAKRFFESDREDRYSQAYYYAFMAEILAAADPASGRLCEFARRRMELASEAAKKASMVSSSSESVPPTVEPVSEMPAEPVKDPVPAPVSTDVPPPKKKIPATMTRISDTTDMPSSPEHDIERLEPSSLYSTALKFFATGDYEEVMLRCAGVVLQLNREARTPETQELLDRAIKLRDEAQIEMSRKPPVRFKTPKPHELLPDIKVLSDDPDHVRYLLTCPDCGETFAVDCIHCHPKTDGADSLAHCPKCGKGVSDHLCPEEGTVEKPEPVKRPPTPIPVPPESPTPPKVKPGVVTVVDPTLMPPPPKGPGSDDKDPPLKKVGDDDENLTPVFEQHGGPFLILAVIALVVSLFGGLI